MAGESLEQADIGWHGIEGDRRCGFVQSRSTSDFPWLTMRQVPALTRYVPAVGMVVTPEGRRLAVDSEELAAELSEACGGPVHLHRDARGVFDAFPLSLMSLQSVAALGAMIGRELAPHRFRTGIVADLPGSGDFPEDELMGRTIALGGSVQVRLGLRDPRYMVVNFDPETAERDPSVLRAIARRRQKCLGVYGSIVRPGAVRVGDQITVVA